MARRSQIDKKSILIGSLIGIVAGIAAGAFLPSKFNPVIMLQKVTGQSPQLSYDDLTQ